MANFKIERFKYRWKGTWVPSQEYNRDDVININGSSYVCIQQHTSAADFNSDLFNQDTTNNVADPRWVKMTDGFSWQGEWTVSTQYQIGDVVLYGGTVWLCVVPYFSGSVFDDNIENWTIYAANLAWTQEWQPFTRYGINDLARYNGTVYRCVEGHESGSSSDGIVADLGEDSVPSKWSVYYENIEYRGEYQLDTIYRQNDLVTYKGTLLRCVIEHQSLLIDDSVEQKEIESANWQVELFGEKFFGDWDTDTFYGVGSVVRHGGYLYYSLTNNYNRVPTFSFDEDFFDSSIDWIILSKGIRFRGTWSQEDDYLTGDVVRKGGHLYVALLDTELFRDEGDSTLDFLDDSKWELLTLGQQWNNTWIIGNFYAAGDLVIYRGSTWQANFNHIADNQNFPGFAAGGFDYWDLVIQSGPNVGMSQPGDLLSFDLIQEFAGDTDTQGPTGIPLGEEDQLFQVGSNSRLGYRGNWGKVARRVYVAPDGIDDTSDPERGFVYYKPWKTVRFAAEWADDGFEGTTTIDVAAGTYEEVLPIIVPARTAVVGSELRSTTIGPNKPIPELEDDAPFTVAVLTRISQLIQAVIAGVELNPPKTPSNLLNPVIIRETFESIDEFEQLIIEEGENPIQTDPQAAIDIQELIIDIQNYIEFYLDNGNILPEIVGTNDANQSEGYTNAVRILNANRNFFAEEAVAFMKETFPSYNFDENLCKRDVNRYIDAWVYDIIFTGNYKSILAARYYRNAVLGSKNEDMFYMRDSSGARNFTAVGLEGTLPTPTPENPYAIAVDAPAFFGLDPGWGPADDRVWIKTRSPYMQNITNFGKAAIGQKINGYLHNGGNRSFVSNDFTQVIDDGIGAWVYNVARAELVSVFTYYCNIGYLTTSGGIIRSTNGNNSYGNFGSVSIGVNPDEVPDTATVNNRTEQAIVSSVFTGEFQDELQIFEWENAGVFYTQVSAQIIGAGAGAEVEFDDFRDDAVFNVRLLDTSDPEDRLIEEIGGSGYRISRSTAQVSESPGDALTRIRLSVNEPLLPEQIVGMRIIIISGIGTGQYAEISSYSFSTKTAIVIRESDGEPGWDHLIPGSPLVELFDNSTIYSVEPKVAFSHPGYSSNLGSFGIVKDWSAGSYGKTKENYQLVATIPVELASRISVPATFSVSHQNRIYVIDSLISGGVGYEVGDSIILPGDELGGISPTNDLIITVLTVNAQGVILTFDIEGLAASEKFVVMAENSESVIRSPDGIFWEESVLPESGDWQVLISGMHKFIAVQGNNSDSAAISQDGKNWQAIELPVSADWVAGTHGNSNFVIIANNGTEVAYSQDGENWSDTVLPASESWTDVAYGKGIFVAVAETSNAAAVSLNAESWSAQSLAAGGVLAWSSVAYGNNRFVAVARTGEIRYSFDGETWLAAEMPTEGAPPGTEWIKIKYAQGVFFAISQDGSTQETNYAATSFDGIVWTPRQLSGVLPWKTVVFGNPYVEEFDSAVGKNTTRWIAIAGATDEYDIISTGARALGRAIVAAGRIGQIRLWDTGSGYLTEPTVEFFDPNVLTDAQVESRLGDGVLTNPSWINRGSGYRVATTRTTITGDGFADIIPVGIFVTITDLDRIPNSGTQIIFDGNDTIYTVVIVTEKANTGNGKLTAEIRLSPELRINDRLMHNTNLIIRRLFSQNRITGHDFLDVGTGNFEQTNYPALYFTGIFTNAPENEIDERDGGKVFYTATNEAGNFKVGELFEVEQATGIVTLSADFFDLGGLTELKLGGVRVGGSGVVIREFSTDPNLTADSNNVVSTQRAIRRFLESRLTVGGSAVEVPGFTAGQVVVGPDQITSAPGLKIILPTLIDFSGDASAIRGSILAQTMFHASFFDPDF